MVKEKVLLLINDKNKQNFFIYGIGQVFNLLSPLIVAPLVIAKCQVAGYGKVGLGFALALFLILIVDYAFDVKGTKAVSENRFDVKILENLLCTTIFTKIILFAIVLLIATVLITAFPFFYQERMLFFLSLTIVFAQVFNPIWFFQGIENFKWISIINITSKVTYVSLVLLFITKPQDYIYVNLCLGASSLVFNGMGLFYVKKKYGLKINIPTFNTVQSILKNDFSFCVSQLFLSARQLAPLVLVTYFLGFSIAGQYRVIEQIINLFRTFSQVFLKFFYAQSCFKFMTDVKMGWNFWKKYTAMNIVIVASTLIVIAFFSTEVLRFFHLSENTIVALNVLFQIALVISFLMSITLPLEQLMFIQDKNQIYIKITIFVTVLNIVLLLVLIHRLELLGVITTLIIAELFFITFYFYNAFLHTKQLIKNENHLT